MWWRVVGIIMNITVSIYMYVTFYFLSNFLPPSTILLNKPGKVFLFMLELFIYLLLNVLGIIINVNHLFCCVVVI